MEEETFYHVLLAATWLLALLTIVAVSFISAPYGRHARPGWGPTIPALLGWVIMESPALWATLLAFVAGQSATHLAPLVLLSLFLVHYFHRVIIFPVLMYPSMAHGTQGCHSRDQRFEAQQDSTMESARSWDAQDRHSTTQKRWPIFSSNLPVSSSKQERLLVSSSAEERVAIAPNTQDQVAALSHARNHLPVSSSSLKQMPVIVVALAFCWNCLNGYLQGRWLGEFGAYPASWLSSPCFVVGTSAFLLGMAVNMHSDYTLRALRRGCATPGHYMVPRGGLFELVSCPNYLGEIVEWVGWAIATWSLPGLVFAVYTAANLMPRAVAHHAWYHKKFADYPQKRKALVPVIF